MFVFFMKYTHVTVCGMDATFLVKLDRIICVLCKTYYFSTFGSMRIIMECTNELRR